MPLAEVLQQNQFKSTQKEMPRFQEEHVASLVRAMLPRVPDCVFAAEDVQQVERETGLNHDQILEWARHLRNRIPINQRGDYFRNINDEKEVT